MNKEQLEAKSLSDLREIAKLQGVKSLTKFRKPELIEIIMNGGRPVDAAPAQPVMQQTEAPQVSAEQTQEKNQQAATSVMEGELLPGEQDGYARPRAGYTPRTQNGYTAHKPYYENRSGGSFNGGYQRKPYVGGQAWQSGYQQGGRGYQQGG